MSSSKVEFGKNGHDLIGKTRLTLNMPLQIFTMYLSTCPKNNVRKKVKYLKFQVGGWGDLVVDDLFYFTKITICQILN